MDHEWTCPPSNVHILPVTKLDLSDARNTDRSATSSKLPKLDNETLFSSISFTDCGLFCNFLLHTDPLNKIFPAAIAFMRMPCFPRGRDIPRTYALSADFATEYVTGASEITSIPQIDDMHTIVPFLNDNDLHANRYH